MKKFTKIVATVSDKRCDIEFIKALADAGVNVVRMNSAHLDYDGFRMIVDNVRAADPSLGIMMDTKGPEIRTTATADGTPVQFHIGDQVDFIGDPNGLSSSSEIFLSYPRIAEVLQPGNRILIADGETGVVVTALNGSRVAARAENDGTVASRKSVNLPGVPV
ncbi:MAG: pyruvate kinase, partial [Muribaculaceae bacterium]|nr:pyruvate kinase [Muribaculaceae bacterium]